MFENNQKFLQITNKQTYSTQIVNKVLLIKHFEENSNAADQNIIHSLFKNTFKAVFISQKTL